MESLQVFFFLGLAIWAISILAVFTTNLSFIMRSPARSKMSVLISLGYMFLFSFLAASLIVRIIIILVQK
ncbi:MAG: hypothetical protein NC932_02425 [Candidatus Omnitrophica bacterium]|nr:hypothetical protein [Candidatus Omnitrophota bacterium]